MNALTRSPLKVSLDGLDPRSRNLFEMFLNGPAQGKCEVIAEARAEAAIFDHDTYGAEQQWLALRGRFQGPAVVMSVIERHLHNAVWVKKPLNAEDFLAAIKLLKERLQTETRLRDLESAAETLAPVAIAPEPVEATPEPASAPVRALAATARDEEEGGVSRAAALTRQDQQIHECCGAMADEAYLDPARRGELFYEPGEYLQGVLQQACRLADSAGAPVNLEVLSQSLIVLAGGKRIDSYPPPPIRDSAG